MTSDLGVSTADECALVLICYLQEQVDGIRSETTELVELQVPLLAKAA